MTRVLRFATSLVDPPVWTLLAVLAVALVVAC